MDPLSTFLEKVDIKGALGLSQTLILQLNQIITADLSEPDVGASRLGQLRQHLSTATACVELPQRTMIRLNKSNENGYCFG